MKRVKGVRDVIQRKGWFLETLVNEVNIAETLGAIRASQKHIDAMPVRGKLQRQQQEQALRDLDARVERLATKLGHQVLRNFRFVEEHKKLLSKKSRKTLGLED